MKELLPLLLNEQKKLTRRPAIEVEISAFGHPAACASIQWSLYGWQQLFSTAGISPAKHGVAIPQDGSLNRIRLLSYIIYHQRVASPGPSSDFGISWTNLYSASVPTAAISATLSGPEVIIFYPYGTDNLIYYRRSTDNGVSFGSLTSINPVAITDGCIAACHKSANEMCIVYTQPTTKALLIKTRTSGLAWSNQPALENSPVIENLAVYYDGDYNVIALVNRSDVFSLARIVFGQGYRVALNTWSDVVYLGLGSASVETADLINQYLEHLPPYSDFETARADYVKLLERRGRG